MNSILLYFYCTFSRSICCVCRTLTKIWPKNIEFYRYSYNVGERAFVFAPPPFTPRSDRCNLIFFLELLILPMYSSLENTTYKEHKSHFWENFEKLCKFSLKMSIFCNIYLVDKKIIDILENFKKSVSLLYTMLVYDFEFATSSWSATSSLLHRNQF